MGIKHELFESIDRQNWLDRLGKPLQKAVRQAYESGGPIGSKVADLLHGTWLGHPLHSVLTDVVIGGFMSAGLFDTLEMTTGKDEFGSAADISVSVGLASAGVTALAGVTDWQHTKGQARRIGMLHALLNTTATALYALSMIQRKGGQRSSGRLLAFAGLGVATASAYLGGHLAYGEKIGMDHAPKIAGRLKSFVPVMPLDELPENQLHRVEVEGLPILLVRRNSQVHAIAEHCAHMGGPLSEGKLEGDVVVCPWHSSRFSIEDGSLVGGPSVYSQPCFETRVQAGQIEVRASSEGHYV